MAKIVIGLSGGVDSSVAAYLLKEQGHEVVGATIVTGMGEDVLRDASYIAQQLGISHHIIDVSSAFQEQIVTYFVESYQQGRTPNPCIVCNPLIKWQALLQKADEIGAEYIATGHYGKVVRLSNGRYTVEKAPYKDQSYVLYRLSQEQLSRTLMVLNGYTKEEVRCIAEEQGLVVAKKADSQEICFIPDHDYGRFIEEHSGRSSASGHFVDPQGNILGEHKGIIHYTIGQRKGLGIVLGEPRFVVALRPETNEVVLGKDEDCWCDGVMADQLNWMMESGPDDKEVLGKIRYAHREESCRIYLQSDGTCRCLFDRPQRAVTPGQAIVWYRDGMVFGGGTVIGGFHRSDEIDA